MCEINVMETVQDAKSVVMCFVLCGPLHTSDKGEFNMVDYVESRLLPKRSTLLPMPSTLLLVLATNLQHCEFAVTLWYTSTPTFECCQGICDKLSRSILLPKHSTLLPIWWTLCQCVRGPKRQSTLLTFNKVDRVEFNFVASVYQAYDCNCNYWRTMLFLLLTLC